ncbi:MAG: DUF6377 domain-containing protein [Bacteroidota bacterium]|nr:DUF6377 domain-containing protein [Bacteroidota bacterium]
MLTSCLYCGSSKQICLFRRGFWLLIKSNIFFLLLIFCCHAGFSQRNSSQLIQDLNEAIRKSYAYDADKLKTIQQLKKALQKEHTTLSFEGYLQLYNEYYLFNYDSAYAYAKKMLDVALQSGNKQQIAYAGVKLNFILLSSGMYKEAFDLLKSINLYDLNKQQRAEYFTLAARCYYDLADYNKDSFYSPQYNLQGNRFIDSSLTLYPDSSFQFIYYNGLKNIRSGNENKAMLYFQKLMHSPSLSKHELALTASTLSDIYIRGGQADSAIHLLTIAAISDIQSSTKETSAAFNLATLLFRKGDLANASIIINRAVNDAVFYGARQRKLQLSTILPLIEAEKLNSVEKGKHNLITYGIIVTLLLVAVIALAIILSRQVKKLKLARQVITNAHHQQQVVNQKLMEANKIKEEYIGYFFSGNSDFYSRIEKFKISLERKIAERKMEEIKFLVNNLNVKSERNDLLKRFDHIFLRLFPSFIEEFNALFKQEDQVHLKEGEFMNTDLRIFALIRLGIHDVNKIAQILEYSVNTINTYKTKTKNKSLSPNEEFELKIMEIKSI